MFFCFSKDTVVLFVFLVVLFFVLFERGRFFLYVFLV